MLAEKQFFEAYQFSIGFVVEQAGFSCADWSQT